MFFNTKKLCQRAFLIFAACSIFTYLFAHAAYMLMDDVAGEIFEYLSLYVSKIYDFIIPTVISAAALLLYVYCGKWEAVRFTLISAAARILYTLPYYYIIFIYNYGYDSVESLSLSLAASLGIAVFTCLGVFLSLSVSLFVIRKKEKAPRGFDVRGHLKGDDAERSPYDFLGGMNLAFLVFCALKLAYSLVFELIDTVSFFIEYGLDYYPVEILTIMFNYVLLLALSAASYAICCKTKRVLLKNRLTEQKQQETNKS